MLKGIIEYGLHPRIEIEIKGEASSKKIPVLVDTGFDSGIALHYTEASKLGLRITGFTQIHYASGEKLREPLGSALVYWHGEWKEVEVILSNDEQPASGTRLLQDSILLKNFVKRTLKIRKIH